MLNFLSLKCSFKIHQITLLGEKLELENFGMQTEIIRN